jgi:allantoicase
MGGVDEALPTDDDAPVEAVDEPSFAEQSIVLSRPNSSTVVFATDEWFATADRLLLNTQPQFDPTAYCPEGKVMDGWETRRRRLPGHDFCLIELGIYGVVRGIELDTRHFTGNHAPVISVVGYHIPPSYVPGTHTPSKEELKLYNEGHRGFNLPGMVERVKRDGIGLRGTACAPADDVMAEEILSKYPSKVLIPPTKLRPGYEGSSVHHLAVNPSLIQYKEPMTHIRLNLFPDGGVARMKVYGDVLCDFDDDIVPLGPSCNLADMHLGATGLGCSNQHFGVPSNMLQRNRGVDMGDGWETARHPTRPAVVRLDPTSGLQINSHSDWSVIRLGAVTDEVVGIVLDTCHFKGNFPESAIVEGCYDPLAKGIPEDVKWFPILARTRMKPDTELSFQREDGGLTEESAHQMVSHVRLTIFPDGGISRLRVYGRGVEAVTPLQKMRRHQSYSTLMSHAVPLNS